MRWLVTGAGGMLAADLLPVLADDDVVALTRADHDITDAAAVSAAIDAARPEVVVNTAAYTAVDAAETDEATALAVNGDGPAHLAAACASSGAVLLHVSTDYVFDGTATSPYAEDAPTGPRSAYGRTKLAGERAVLGTARGYVVRAAWLYGAGGPNFVATMARLERERDTIDVVDDQHGQPTWTADLATVLRALGEQAYADAAPPGVYHGTNAGKTTWYGLAREVFSLLGADPDRVHRTTTEAFPRPAPRPAWSVLAHDHWAAAGLPPLRDWRTALHAAAPTVLGLGR